MEPLKAPLLLKLTSGRHECVGKLQTDHRNEQLAPRLEICEQPVLLRCHRVGKSRDRHKGDHRADDVDHQITKAGPPHFFVHCPTPGRGALKTSSSLLRGNTSSIPPRVQLYTRTPCSSMHFFLNA